MYGPWQDAPTPVVEDLVLTVYPSADASGGSSDSLSWPPGEAALVAQIARDPSTAATGVEVDPSVFAARSQAFTQHTFADVYRAWFLAMRVDSLAAGPWAPELPEDAIGFEIEHDPVVGSATLRGNLTGASESGGMGRLDFTAEVVSSSGWVPFFDETTGEVAGWSPTDLSWPTVLDWPVQGGVPVPGDTGAGVSTETGAFTIGGVDGPVTLVLVPSLLRGPTPEVPDVVAAGAVYSVDCTLLAAQATVTRARYRFVYPDPVVKGMWRLRQRQSLVGTDSWPLRQRQNGGATGSWPLRQRQRGV